MDFVEVSRSLLVVPSKYENVQPHHLAIGYAFYRLLASSSIVQKASKFLLNVLSNSTESFIPMVKMGLVPDFLIRFGIRVQLYNHLNVLAADNVETELKNKTEIVHKLKTMPIAIATDEANEQHYEVPAKFYDLCLGPRKKYSSGLWPNKDTTFEESEVAMLEHYCQLAGVEDGMSIVDLGCGWGSLTLHLAERYPNAKITGISNSHSQREYILNTAKERGYNVGNITIVTCNVSDDKGALDVVKGNDRVMTVEMFEHMKNYDHLMEKVNGFLKPGGKLFVHIFTHKDYTYHFDKGWMSDNFFTGGTMPSDDLLLYFANHFKIENHWRVNGTNYEKTSNGWLDYLDKSWKSGELKPVLAQAYGEGNEREW
eukprot:CAMPEP_0172451416 /NCGR_PEP_ID=MMETSP1065-20121228/9473_1 /TAXON_ID=265537 /ORGANISM="Amphiprora paludosa, Strain CCMP125" /LENGTH=369 /DNA_ID=CAMNT_0013203371 /DNA_START=50 /DNA_END=1156 /DNA_ORIENTATION=-